MALEVRKEILSMSLNAGVAHIPSALSQCDYLGVLLMNKNINPLEYKFVLGKPFGAQAYYSLFKHCGWIDGDLSNYGSLKPEWRYIIQKEHPLVEFIDESMGNCLSVGCGLALGGKKVFVNISDAAFQEGSVWESILFAGAKKLGQLIMAIDYNGMQALGKIDSILSISPLQKKLEAFGWDTLLVNGNDIESMDLLIPMLDKRSNIRPLALIFKTVKGAGCQIMENDETWHYRILDEKSYLEALNSLSL